MAHDEEWDISTALQTADELKIPVSDRDCYQEYSWDGKSIATLRNGKKRSASDLFHEIAHYQCAMPSRRKLPEFGLGSAPDSNKYIEKVIGYPAGTAEECKASLLGIAWELQHGIGERAAQWARTLVDHNWDIFKTGSESMFRHIEWLHRHGLMQNGDPQIALRTKR